MQCSEPPPLNDAQLSAVLDDIHDAEVQKHLARCRACTVRLEGMRRLDGLIEHRVARFDCPPAQQLVDYQLAMLDSNTLERMEQHIAACPRCQQELKALDYFLSEDAPEAAALRPSSRILRPSPRIWHAQVEISGSLALKRLRGASDEATRDAKAGSASLFLEALPAAKGILLTGQIVDERVDWRGSIAEVQQQGVGRRVRALDELCEFSFELTSTSPMDLYVTSYEGVVLTLEGIDITR